MILHIALICYICLNFHLYRFVFLTCTSYSPWSYTLTCSLTSGGIEFDVLWDNLLVEDDKFYPAILMSSPFSLGYLVQLLYLLTTRWLWLLCTSSLWSLSWLESAPSLPVHDSISSSLCQLENCLSSNSSCAPYIQLHFPFLSMKVPPPVCGWKTDPY